MVGRMADDPVIRGMIGDSEVMRGVYRLTRQVAGTSATVLLTGETGTGKELIARALHEHSARASGPFVRVNCGALSDSLLESELFGHVKGAFTSAVENRTGRFEAAHGGTIFLDEINSVNYQLQVKLLRVLQEHEFERVGDTRTIKIDCRVVAATNRDLMDEIAEDRFREDLYYRLNVIPIDLPPLRERQSDIPLLVQFFLGEYSRRNSVPVPAVAPGAVDLLTRYSWPGNVRELQNYIERTIVLSNGETITPDMLPPHVRGLKPIRVGRKRGDDLESLCRDLVSAGIREADQAGAGVNDYVMSRVERELISQILNTCRGVQTRTATRLGINRNTLHKKVEDYGLESEVR